MKRHIEGDEPAGTVPSLGTAPNFVSPDAWPEYEIIDKGVKEHT